MVCTRRWTRGPTRDGDFLGVGDPLAGRRLGKPAHADRRTYDGFYGRSGSTPSTAPWPRELHPPSESAKSGPVATRSGAAHPPSMGAKTPMQMVAVGHGQ